MKVRKQQQGWLAPFVGPRCRMHRQQVPCHGVFFTFPPRTLQQLPGPAAGRAAVGKSASSTSCSPPFPSGAVLLHPCCWEQPAQCGHPAGTGRGWPGWCPALLAVQQVLETQTLLRTCSSSFPTSSRPFQNAASTSCSFPASPGTHGGECRRHPQRENFGEVGCAWCPCFAPSPGRISPLLVGFFPSCQAGERNGTRLDSSAEEPRDNRAEPWKCLFLELICGRSLSDEVPQPHPSPHGHSHVRELTHREKKGK